MSARIPATRATANQQLLDLQTALTTNQTEKEDLQNTLTTERNARTAELAAKSPCLEYVSVPANHNDISVLANQIQAMVYGNAANNVRPTHQIGNVDKYNTLLQPQKDAIRNLLGTFLVNIFPGIFPCLISTIMLSQDKNQLVLSSPVTVGTMVPLTEVCISMYMCVCV